MCIAAPAPVVRLAVIIISCVISVPNKMFSSRSNIISLLLLQHWLVFIRLPISCRLRKWGNSVYAAAEEDYIILILLLFARDSSTGRAVRQDTHGAACLVVLDQVEMCNVPLTTFKVFAPPVNWSCPFISQIYNKCQISECLMQSYTRGKWRVKRRNTTLMRLRQSTSCIVGLEPYHICSNAYYIYCLLYSEGP